MKMLSSSCAERETDIHHVTDDLEVGPGAILLFPDRGPAPIIQRELPVHVPLPHEQQVSEDIAALFPEDNPNPVVSPNPNQNIPPGEQNIGPDIGSGVALRDRRTIRLPQRLIEETSRAYYRNFQRKKKK